jgi:Ca2+-binding RTX toxin-like protein
VTLTSSGDFSGSERNDLLTGDDGVNRINGLGGNDRITGGLAADQLTSGTGIDQFLYRSFAESSVAFGVDSTDAAFTSGDRIGLPTRPSSLSNVGVITGASSLAQAFGLAQADIDPLTAGAQPLAPGQAVMFTYGSTTKTQRTYLGVADADTGSVTNDFLLLTPQAQFAIGSLDVQAFFL